MAGHSKWANIKHKKAKEDAKRGKEFTKLIKEITIAARSGGDITGNPRLRTLVDKAKKINMPSDNITRAIKKGTGELPGVSYEHVTYEGHGPGGSAILVEVLTDNKNRAVADMRHIFSKYGGNLGETGAVNWMFEKLGVIRTKSPDMSEEELFEQLIEQDLQDLSIHDGVLTITTPMQSLNEVTEAVKNLNIDIDHSELEWIAKNPMAVAPEHEEKAFLLLEKLEDNDDVQNVYTNLA
ncbi:MAG: YebC/PmpR family DNA-binding transcriptional regulator [Epsilonproteobacteria bacterium]|nr:YebC/PmpR family DNA-binding transcriptional regulator [Campylobacterota bacterium]|tara:strand:- start:83 stop:796 length:714 start_codon:yes stop_codon:yes gene_type:complete